MTELVERAIERLRAMPEPEQDGLARFLLNELDQDDRWATSTSTHIDTLARFAEQILADDTAGKCEPLDADKL